MASTRGALIGSLVLVGFFWTLGSCSSLSAQDVGAPVTRTRAPQPSPLERKDAAKSIRKVFKSQYARKSADDRRRLAKSLLREAKKDTSDNTTRFELLSESRKVAIRVADLDTAFEAIDQLDVLFRIDRLDWIEETLGEAPRPKTLGGAAALHNAWQTAVDSAIDDDDYESATRVAAAAHKAIKKTRDKVLINDAKAREEFVEAIAAQHKKVTPFLRRLLDDPDNESARGEVAEFLSLYKRDWDAGFDTAVKGPASPLKEAAGLDLEKPKKPADQVAVGNAWADLADDYKDVPRVSCHIRAVLWLERAILSLDEITKAAVTKRLAKIYKETPSLRAIVGLDRLRTLVLEGKSQTRFWESNWKPRPLDAMALSRAGAALRVKNTTGSSSTALLSETTKLNGDFTATLEVYGGSGLGLVSSSLRNVKLEVKLGKGWQRIRVERKDGKIAFLVNGRKSTPEKMSRWVPNPPENLGGFFFVSLRPGQECRLRNFELRADLDAPESNATDEWRKRLGRGRGDDDDDDDDDDDSGRTGRSGRGRSGRGR